MKVMTQAKELIGGSGETAKDAREQTNSTVKEARKQASSTVRTARKKANRQLVRARIAAARARARGRSGAAGASKKAVGAAGAAGLAAGYFLDPESGKRRRHVARDRTLALIRRGADRARREAEYREDQVEGKLQAAAHGRDEKPAPNDQALADRVKSEIFQPEDAPKGSVNVNVERGVVYLRGEVKRPDEIRKLVEQAGAVDGVAGVENLLHTP
ncbi:MAG: BON domain-containing protein [Solirubrobacterales bacterium]